MTLLRVGSMHRLNSRIRSRLSHMKQCTIIQQDAYATRVWSFSEIQAIVEPMLSSPTLRGLLSLLLRTIPLHNTQDSADSLEKAIQKELSITQQTTRVAKLSYPFFSTFNHAASIPMSPDLPFRPFLNITIRARLRHWRESLAYHTYLPQCSFKSIGSIGRDNLLRQSQTNFANDSKRPVSTADLERYYMETGYTVEGPCEVRAAWKYNDLKPRIYYAIGPSAYFAARYTWHVFDSLQRAFKCTDPHHRFSFHRFPMIDFSYEVFMIYDYESFTSNLVDFPRFTLELGDFIKGIRAKRFDTHSGIEEFDVGQLVENYNSVCNEKGEFDVSRVVHMPDGTSRLILNHHVAGMLGVYGNITGSTALHGLVGMVIAGSEDRVNAIGDDAGGIFDSSVYTVDEIRDQIRVLGTIADDKFELWTEDQSLAEDGIGWKFVKRPLNVTYGVITQGWMPDFPIYPVLLDQADDSHTTQSLPLIQRRRSAVRQSIRLMESMRAHIGLITDADIQITLEFLRWLFRALHLPQLGSLPTGKQKIDMTDRSWYPDEYLATPVLVEESIRIGWWTTLRERASSDTGVVRIPLMGDKVALPNRMFEGDEFEGIGSKIMGLLENIGIIRKQVMYEVRLLSDETLDIYEDYITGRRKALYKYQVMETYPQWETYLCM